MMDRDEKSINRTRNKEITIKKTIHCHLLFLFHFPFFFIFFIYRNIYIYMYHTIGSLLSSHSFMYWMILFSNSLL